MPTPTRYVICYPGGAGGSFVASVLNSILNNTQFIVNSQLGHCHNNKTSMPNFFHGDTVESFINEISLIKSFDFSQNNVWHGHYRNIVAIKETIVDQLGYHEVEKTKFIKISVDHQKNNEIEFIAQMLRRKANSWTNMLFDEFLIQTTHYVKSWYWIENAFTTPHTTTLSLPDIFLNNISTKIELCNSLCARLDQHQLEYLSVQQQLHQDILDLLCDQ